MALSCIHLFLLCAHHKQKHGVCPRQLQPSWCADVCVAVRAVNGSGSGSCRKTVILRVGCGDCATPLWRIQFVLDRRLGTTALVSLAGCMRYPQLIDSNRRAHYSKSWYSVIRGADLADGASYRRSVKPIRLRVSANLVSCLRNLEKKNKDSRQQGEIEVSRTVWRVKSVFAAVSGRSVYCSIFKPADILDHYKVFT